MMKMAADACVGIGIICWLITVIFSVWGLKSRSKCKYGTAKVLAFPVFLLTIAVLAICLIFSVTISDFCVGNPRAYLVEEAFPQDSPDGKKFLEYYFTCVARRIPLQEPVG
jgi:hypothetical protein